ncbi:MAG: helix-turn-helix domain-containing protein [Lachnospiraceae bacterium]|nr:helix-turn-helix domain-containing protein [Lachnospiraceae bacterium]
MAEHYESEAFIYNQVPVRIFNHYYDGLDIFTALHWHRNIEFNLTTAGRIKMNIDGESVLLPAGEWCVVNSGELHANHWIEPNDHFEGICEGQKKEGRTDEGDSNLKAIINYMDEHYMEQMDLSTVAAAFNYTPTYLSRMFKEHVGRNFYQYLQNVRLMNCVEEMKEDENVRLMECALNHGFPNAKSFIQTFKKTFGCTPSEWMKQGKKSPILVE